MSDPWGNVTPLRRVDPAGRRPPPEPLLNLPPATRVAMYVLIGIHAGFVLGRELGDAAALWSVLIQASLMLRSDAVLAGDPLGLLGVVTSALLHGGWLHLGFNVVSLAAFGSLVERRWGWRAALIVFALAHLSGVAAELALAVGLGEPRAMLGASAGILGLTAAAVLEMRYGGDGRQTVGIWIAILLLGAFLSAPGGGAIAWAAHIGGFMAGAMLHQYWLSRRN